MKEMLKHFALARRASAPLVAITTCDPASTIVEIGVSVADSVPIAQWDIINGITSLNSRAQDCVVRLINDSKPPALVTGNPVEALVRALKLPPESILFFSNAQMYMEDKPGSNPAPIIQAIWNLRDVFKASKRTLVMLVPQISLPIELKNDILVIDEPLPSDKELASIVIKSFGRHGLKHPGKTTLPKIVSAISGLASFNADQVVAMSLKPNSRARNPVDINQLWRHKIQIIEQENGLMIHRGGPRFDDIGGNENIKRLLLNVAKGNKKPALVVFIDEIEKVMHAADTDTSGTTTDQLKVLLTEMQNNNWDGVICYGFSGTGKSELAKAFGNEVGCITAEADMGAMKDRWVGSSEQKMRSFVKTIKALSGGPVFFIATCNKAEGLVPELKRRYKKGVFFCDLPDQREREVIWKIHCKRTGINIHQSRPNDDGWTGAEIRACCDNAQEFGVSLKEASKFVTVVSKEMGESAVKAKRQHASGKYISAHKPGVYIFKEDQTPIKSFGDERVAATEVK